MKKPKIKSIPYEDFVDNESLEQMVKELNEGGANVFLGALDDVINWGRSNSLWPLTFATSCCGIEFMSLGAARYDMARFGFEVARASPRQADMIMVCGTIPTRWLPCGATLRPNGRSQIRSCRRWLCSKRRSIQEVLSRTERSRQDTTRRCIHTRLSSPPRSILLRINAIATQGKG